MMNREVKEQGYKDVEIRPYDGEEGSSSGLSIFQSKLSKGPEMVINANNENNSNGNDDVKVMSHFPYNLVIKVATSEPRDVLQSERTCLTFVRFAAALFFTALGIILNFKLDTSGNNLLDKPGKHPRGFNHSKYSQAASFVMLILSLLVLVISTINYFITINRYAQRKIETYNFNNLTTMICMTGIIVSLGVINITMIIEGFLEES
ncbi:hypothetical protein KGF56_002159 [Candida oxycetoniae]|uniref:DUF202 domain-containing protein n=1 Tax=Candida oxycetoniae TaxID=497107 RepID=A0AAI9SY33_9ASCO|nr:uncharacterized protein KGF56_002159 [Candida oxycetoniae]KAI3404994.2 hypothetical protein KGF56_002159 [Candida oxycetoniae]